MTQDWTGRRVQVCWNYDTTHTELGTIERDFGDTPTLIQLDNGQLIFGTECQWRPLPPEPRRQRDHME